MLLDAFAQYFIYIDNVHQLNFLGVNVDVAVTYTNQFLRLTNQNFDQPISVLKTDSDLQSNEHIIQLSAACSIFSPFLHSLALPLPLYLYLAAQYI
jgi:hypothetical protein